MYINSSSINRPQKIGNSLSSKVEIDRRMKERTCVLSRKDNLSQKAKDHMTFIESLVVQNGFKLFAPKIPAHDIEAWEDESSKRNNDEFNIQKNKAIVEEYSPTIDQFIIGGVPVIDIKPKGWADNRKVLVYLHGGGYTIYDADKYLYGAVPLADKSGLRIISVSYTRSPRSTFMSTINEIERVINGLKLEYGYRSESIGLFGDSAGAGLAMSVVVHMRDQGEELPGAIAGLCGFYDLTNSGKSYKTQKDKDFILDKESMALFGLAFAGNEDSLINPYASPLFADFDNQAWPPTLLQAAGQDMLKSDSKELFRKLITAGVDVYYQKFDGLNHGFQAFVTDLPETAVAVGEIAKFFNDKLEQ